MKKLLMLIFLMSISLGQSQTLTGRWKMTSLGVGPSQGNTGWWSLSVSSGDRACLFDDEYVFAADGTFSNVQGSQTYREGWLGAGCGAPTAPFDGSNPATFTTDGSSVTVTGTGAYIGLPKAINGSEINSTEAHPGTVTYLISSLISTTLTLDINVGGGWWRFVLEKQAEVSANTPVITGFESISKFNTDAPFSLTTPTSNSAGAFTYTSSNESVATISGSTVTIVGVGTSTITATQAANGSYVSGSTSAQLVVTYAPPSVGATAPVARNAWDVVSIYTDNTYADLAGTSFYPNWGQSTQFATYTIGSDNTLKYSNLNYQGIQFASGINVSAMDTVHFDLWTADCNSFQFFLIGGGENAVTVTPTKGGWNSFDIPMSSYAARTLTNIIQFKMVGNGTVYLDNIYFSRAATSAVPPTIGALTVPAKVVGDAPFSLTAPTSNSTGAFTYTSSNTAVATISGSTVTVVGAGASTITATQAADGSFGTGNVVATLNVTPNNAPTPANAAEDVISVFSNAYTDVAATNFFPNWGQSTQYASLNVSGNAMLNYSNLNYQGIQLAAPINASTMQNLHIDIWTPDCTSFQIYLINEGIGEQGITVNPSLSGWNSYDIPLASYTTVNKSNIGQFKIVGSGTVFLDNLYFWKLPAGTNSYYVDADGDGYGAGTAVLSTATTAPAGYSVYSTDCNDSNAAIYPGATEIADTLDNDCDGSVDEGFPPTIAAPTPPARNAWDVKSIFSGAYANVTLDELPTSWSQTAIAPFTVESIAGNDTWKFGGEFLGMVTNYGSGVDLTDMTMMHIDYWTPDSNIIIAKIVNTVDGGDATALLEDPTQTGSWRSRDIPMSDFGGSINKSKITQILIDPQSGGSTVYIDNFYFYRPATGSPSPSIGALTVPAKVVGDASFDLTAPTSNSDGAFTYTSSNESVATISGATVTIVGAGSAIITASQAAAGAYGAGSTTATLVVSIATAAPTPTVPGDRVLSIFSGAAGYANATGTNFYPNWGQATQYNLTDVAGNATLKYSNLNYQGVQLASEIDVTTYDTVHIDVYGAGTSAVDFRLINQAGGAGSGISQVEVNSALTLNPGWNTFALPLSSFTGLDLSRIGQLMFVGSETIYVDNIYFSKAVPTPVAPTVADIAFCKGSVSALTAVASGTNSLKWYTVATGGTPSSTAPVPTITTGTKTYWVAQVMSNGVISPRASMVVTVNNLPATPSALASTESAVICKYIGSSTPVTFTATATGAVSYIWTVPTGASIVSGDGTASIGVSFNGASTTVGAIGAVTVKSVDTNGCTSLVKSLTLTTKLPTAPTALTMTSTDSTPHFKGITTPATESTPAVYGSVGLNTLSKITKVGPYTGTNTVFTLTAPTAVTAASYAWTLPTGVTQLSGGNSNVITVDFASVTAGTTALPIVVQSVGGCGNSTNRTLTLTRALPTAPTKLVLTDDAISTTTAVTKVGPYTGKSTELTLTATPFTTQGGTATSYAWVLPAGVVCKSAHTSGTTLTGSTVIETVPTPWTINDAISTTTSTITIDFSGVASGVTSLPLKVFAVNGAGNSIARTLTLTAAAPTSPAITAVGGTTFNSCNLKTYSVVQTPGTSYTWTVPSGATFVQTGNSIAVDYSGVEAAIGTTVQVSCVASNGTGSSVAKVLNVKRVACPPARLSAVAEDFNVVAYPNPSSDVFTIDVQSSDKGATGVQVYDMAGRLIESRQAKSNSVEVGKNYASGVYNVKVNKGTQVKTLRVIKK